MSKLFIALIILLLLSTPSFGVKQALDSGRVRWTVHKSKINSNFTELYGKAAIPGPQGVMGPVGEQGSQGDPGVDGDRITETIVQFGSLPTTGALNGDLPVTSDWTITSNMVSCNPPGSIQVDIWKYTSATYPPDISDSITGSSPISLVTGIEQEDVILTGWSTTLTKGDKLRYVVDSSDTVEFCTIVLKGTSL